MPPTTRAVGRLAERLDRCDLLVNNAAIGYDTWESPSTTDVDAPREIFDTNIFGPWRLTQALLPLLRRSPHARIVNVSSGAGSTPSSASNTAAGSGRSSSRSEWRRLINCLRRRLETASGPPRSRDHVSVDVRSTPRRDRSQAQSPAPVGRVRRSRLAIADAMPHRVGMQAQADCIANQPAQIFARSFRDSPGADTDPICRPGMPARPPLPPRSSSNWDTEQLRSGSAAQRESSDRHNCQPRRRVGNGRPGTTQPNQRRTKAVAASPYPSVVERRSVAHYASNKALRGERTQR